MRLLLELVGAWTLACLGILLLSAGVLALEERLRWRRLRRELDQELRWILSGGIDVPLPPRPRRLRLRLRRAF